MPAPYPYPTLTKDDVAAMILSAKKSAGLSWEEIAEKLEMSPVWTHAACTGMAAMLEDKAEIAASMFNLPEGSVAVLAEPPEKVWSRDIPTDPCIYRLYEIAGVYGKSVKDLIHEKFGDGIMSAIDFEMEVRRVPDPKGDRVKIEMSGKFLPYRTW